MGIKIGEWPIETFSSEEQAKNWAAKQEFGDRERRIWSVAIPADTATFSAEKIPASVKLKQETP
jgi:hypothetical protein